MRVALFVPCYIDQFYPQVGMATLQVLERLGVEIAYPEEQTCCGQPLANAGAVADAAAIAGHFHDVFAGFDHVVAPSGSCVSMVRNYYARLLPHRPEVARLSASTYELCEFLTDVLKIDRIDGRFPHKVGLHHGCHGLRGLRLGGAREVQGPRPGKVDLLLSSIEGLELVPLERPDECCGFGGLFAVTEEATSCMMGRDRVADHERSGAQIVTGVDMSCLMHLDGLIRRERRPLRVMHVAEVLAASQTQNEQVGA